MHILRLSAVLTATVLLLAAAGCCELTRQSDRLVVTLVTDTSGVGDKGFNEICWNGLQRARDELGVVVKKIESSDPANYVKNLSIAARYSDLTIANGFLLLDAMAEVSGHYPDSRFVFIDGEIPDRPNVASYIFRAEEIGFLAGILAAGMSRSHRIGVLKGMNIPSVEAFDFGYRAGILCADATWGHSTDVRALTVGSFNDPKKGNLMTRQLISDGRDVVFQLSGATGLGAITAVRDSTREAFLIGVDLDQDDEAPGKILTSALKRIDVVVFEAVRELRNGRFRGGHHSIGVAEGALSFTDMRHTRRLIPAEVKQAIERGREKIIGRGIRLPQSYKEAEVFRPVNLLEAGS
jgi:basic membrane protein A